MFRDYVGLSRAVYILCLGTFVNRAGSMIVPFLTIYLQRQLDLGVSFATWAMGLYGAGSLAAALIGGHLADLIGRRWVMIFAMFGSGAILLIFSLLTKPLPILLAVFFFALVAEMYRPAASAMIADLTSPRRRPHAFSLMYVSVNLGFAVAPVVGGLLANHSFQWLFWGDALTSSLYGVIILTAIRETLPTAASSSTGDQNLEQGDSGKHDGRASATMDFRSAMRHILRDTTFLIFCAASLAVAGVFMQALSTFPLYLGMKGIGPATYGKIIAVNGVMIALLQIPLTSAVARFNRGSVVMVGAILTALGFGLFGLATSIGHFVAFIMIWTVGEMMIAPFGSAIVSDLAPIELRARYMGIFTTCFSSALMFAVPLGGWVLQRWGGGYVWAGCAVSGLVAAALYFSIRGRIGGPTRTAPKQ